MSVKIVLGKRAETPKEEPKKPPTGKFGFDKFGSSIILTFVQLVIPTVAIAIAR